MDLVITQEIQDWLTSSNKHPRTQIFCGVGKERKNSEDRAEIAEILFLVFSRPRKLSQGNRGHFHYHYYPRSPSHPRNQDLSHGYLNPIRQWPPGGTKLQSFYKTCNNQTHKLQTFFLLLTISLCINSVSCGNSSPLPIGEIENFQH